MLGGTSAVIACEHEKHAGGPPPEPPEPDDDVLVEVDEDELDVADELVADELELVDASPPAPDGWRRSMMTGPSDGEQAASPMANVRVMIVWFHRSSSSRAI